MTPREKFTAVVDGNSRSLTGAERRALKDAGDEYAAAMIERHAHPPLPPQLSAPPVVVQARSLRSGGTGRAGSGESGTGAQGGAA